MAAMQALFVAGPPYIGGIITLQRKKQKGSFLYYFYTSP